MSDDENPREELYQRFRESLRRPVSERFFDEDELVEVYDYAGDSSAAPDSIPRARRCRRDAPCCISTHRLTTPTRPRRLPASI